MALQMTFLRVLPIAQRHLPTLPGARKLSFKRNINTGNANVDLALLCVKTWGLFGIGVGAWNGLCVTYIDSKRNEGKHMHTLSEVFSLAPIRASGYCVTGLCVALLPFYWGRGFRFTKEVSVESGRLLFKKNTKHNVLEKSQT